MLLSIIPILTRPTDSFVPINQRIGQLLCCTFLFKQQLIRQDRTLSFYEQQTIALMKSDCSSSKKNAIITFDYDDPSVITKTSTYSHFTLFVWPFHAVISLIWYEQCCMRGHEGGSRTGSSSGKSGPTNGPQVKRKNLCQAANIFYYCSHASGKASKSGLYGMITMILWCRYLRLLNMHKWLKAVNKRNWYIGIWPV